MSADKSSDDRTRRHDAIATTRHLNACLSGDCDAEHPSPVASDEGALAGLLGDQFPTPARAASLTPAPSRPCATDARQIVAFVQALHADHRPWALLVHCTAGVSRSTATALWVREHCGVTAPDVPELGRVSSPWRPNKTLARLLREAAAEVTT